MWNKLVSLLGTWLITTFPGRAKLIEVDGKPYLHRFYIKHNGRLPGIYLHHFHQSDPDRDLHNHPWRWSFSLILTGGYFEERLVEAGPYRKIGPQMSAYGYLKKTTLDRKAPGFNYITGDTFHRVVLKDLKNGAWTIFCSGPEVKDWGFMTIAGTFIPHMKYLGLNEPFQDKAPNRL